jgi:hypothetical protein
MHIITSVSRTLRAAFLQALAAGLLVSAVAAPVDESRPYGRVCIGVVTGETEEPLKVITGETKGPPQANSEPRADSRLVVHADANKPCQMLVFACNVRDGKLAHDWLPQLAELPPWREVLLPEASRVWKWSADSEPIDIYVLFVSPNSEEAHELKILIMAMLNPTVDRELLDRQSVKLRELATRSRESETIRVVKPGRVEAGVTYRGSSFPWRDYASKANFSEAKPVLLIFRIGNQ